MSNFKKKAGLGRGLSTLLGPSNSNFNLDENRGYSNQDDNIKNIKEISLKDIQAMDSQPRKFFDQEKIIELAQSIEKNGLIQPIIVFYDTDSYKIIAGERRFRACKYLNKKSIDCIVVEKKSNDNSEILTKALIENIQREDLTPLEEAESYKTILDTKDYTHQQLADEIGKSRSYITNTIRILNLPDEIKDLIASEVVSSGHAKVLLSSENPLNYIENLKNGISVKHLNDLIKKESSLNNVNEESLIDKNLKTKINYNTEKEGNEEDNQVSAKLYSLLKSIYPEGDESLENDEIEKSSKIRRNKKKSSEVIKYIEDYIKEHSNLDISMTINENESGKISISYKSFEELYSIIEKIF